MTTKHIMPVTRAMLEDIWKTVGNPRHPSKRSENRDNDEDANDGGGKTAEKWDSSNG